MRRYLLIAIVALLTAGCQTTRYSGVEPIGGYRGAKQMAAMNASADVQQTINWYSGCDIGVGPRDGFGPGTDRSWLEIEYTPSTTAASDEVVLYVNGAYEKASGANVSIDYYRSGMKDMTLNDNWRVERNKPWGNNNAYDQLTISGFSTVDHADPKFALTVEDAALFKSDTKGPYVRAPSAPRDTSDINMVPKITAVRGGKTYRLVEVKYQGYIFHFVMGDAGGLLPEVPGQ